MVLEIDAVMGMFIEKNLENHKSYTMFKKAVLVYMESQQYKHAEYVNRVFTNYVDGLDELAKDKPTLPNETSVGYVAKLEFELRMIVHMQTEVELKATLRAAFNLVWGQLTPGLQAMIVAHNDYEQKALDCDLVV